MRLALVAIIFFLAFTIVNAVTYKRAMHGSQAGYQIVSTPRGSEITIQLDKAVGREIAIAIGITVLYGVVAYAQTKRPRPRKSRTDHDIYS